MEFFILNRDNSKIKLGEINDRSGPCNTLDLYFGQMWYEIQSRMGMIPGKCPIPKVH